MNDNERELQNVAMITDIVNLSLCMQLYPICNDKLFNFLTPLEFSNFLNLKVTAEPVNTRKRQNVYICYLTYRIENHASPHDIGKMWAEAFLKQCGISLKYYHSHYRDVCNKNASIYQKSFRESIDSVFEEINKSNNDHEATTDQLQIIETAFASTL